jgi:hypothetical protein
MSIDQGFGPPVSRDFATCLDVMATTNLIGIGSKNTAFHAVTLAAGATPLLGTIVGVARIIYGGVLSFAAKFETNEKDRQIKNIIADHHIDHGCRELIPGYLLYKIIKFAQDDHAPNPHLKREELRTVSGVIVAQMEALEKAMEKVKDPMKSEVWKDNFIAFHNAHVKWYDMRDTVDGYVQHLVEIIDNLSKKFA